MVRRRGLVLFMHLVEFSLGYPLAYGIAARHRGFGPALPCFALISRFMSPYDTPQSAWCYFGLVSLGHGESAGKVLSIPAVDISFVDSNVGPATRKRLGFQHGSFRLCT